MVPFPVPSLWHAEKQRPTILQKGASAQLVEHDGYEQWTTSISAQTDRMLIGCQAEQKFDGLTARRGAR